MKIQHKRSAALDNGAAKEPTAAQTEFGELCVNFNSQDPALFIRDNADNIVRIGGDLSLYQKVDEVPNAVFVCPPSEIDTQSPPAQREEGALWWNTEEGILYVWYKDADSSQWVITVPQGGGAGEVPPGTTVDITPPSPAVAGQLWWNSDQIENGGGRLYVYYDNAWVDTSVPGGKGSYLNESEAKGLFLSKTEDDTAAGAITFTGETTHNGGLSSTTGEFSGLTTHEAGVNVTGGRNVTISNNASPFFAGYDNGSDLITEDIYIARAQLQSQGTNANDIYIYSSAGGAQANTTGTLYAYHSNFESTHNGGRVYNFYAAGTAPNYFAGKITATANLELAGTQGDLTENPANSNTIGSAVRADGVISCNMSAADKYWHIRKNVASPYIQFSGNGLSTEGLIKRSSASVTTSGIIIGTRIASDEVASAGIADALDTIKALTPNTKGFTVQDYSDYLPHLILDTDETGIDVDHVSVIPILTKALQETIAKNEELEARLAALEGA